MSVLTEEQTLEKKMSEMEAKMKSDAEHQAKIRSD